MKIKALLTIVFLTVFHIAQAQGEQDPDFIRSIGKIYVVAGVCLMILVALFIFMIQLDRKISRIEKRQKNE